MGRRDPSLGRPLCGNVERARSRQRRGPRRPTSIRQPPTDYAATNWGSDNWKLAKTFLPFLEWFDGELVSADVGLLKPDPRFFELLMRPFRLTPSSTLYIADNSENIKQACQTGFVVHHFTDSDGLTRRLEGLALIP
jgi:2-haloacid dehalogenase